MDLTGDTFPPMEGDLEGVEKKSGVEGRVSCKCGWTGKHTELIKKGSVTHADEWWECPACGGDSSKRTTKMEQLTALSGALPTGDVASRN